MIDTSEVNIGEALGLRTQTYAVGGELPLDEIRLYDTSERGLQYQGINVSIAPANGDLTDFQTSLLFTCPEEILNGQTVLHNSACSEETQRKLSVQLSPVQPYSIDAYRVVSNDQFDSALEMINLPEALSMVRVESMYFPEREGDETVWAKYANFGLVNDEGDLRFREDDNSIVEPKFVKDNYPKSGSGANNNVAIYGFGDQIMFDAALGSATFLKLVVKSDSELAKVLVGAFLSEGSNIDPHHIFGQILAKSNLPGYMHPGDTHYKLLEGSIDDVQNGEGRKVKLCDLLDTPCFVYEPLEG